MKQHIFNGQAVWKMIELMSRGFSLTTAAQKRDKKLKKVLDKGQYEQWLRLEDEVMAPFRFKPEPDRPGRPGPKNVETLFR